MGTFRIFEEQIQESDSVKRIDILMGDGDLPESKEREIMNQFEYSENIACEEPNADKISSAVTIQIENTSTRAPDTLSLASSSSSLSSSASSSSISVMVDPGKKHQSGPAKVLGPANEAQNRTQNQSHSRIRRVPSTANPKYKTPKLRKTQRSHSQPQLQFNSMNSQRRNSSPSALSFQGALANIHSGNSNSKQQQSHSQMQSIPMLNPGQIQLPFQPQQSQTIGNPNQQQQQQVIYLQIPQPSQSQMYDPQALQSQISSQLQQLVPQIYSQLLNQISSGSNEETLKTLDGSKQNMEPTLDSSCVNPNFSVEGQSQRMINQIFEQNSKSDQKIQQSVTQQKRQQKTNSSQSLKQNSAKSSQPTENSTQISAEDISKYLQIENISQILQQIPPHILQQNSSAQQTSYIEIQQLPGCPKITIPITQELLLQCQQFQQHRDMGYSPYQPRLETILEESLSVKHLNMNKFPKTKIIACILTVLCVVVVVLLAGDKTVAVVVVAVVFIVFLLASIFYLYINSTKNQLTSALTHSDSQRIQVNTISTCDKPSSMV